MNLFKFMLAMLSVSALADCAPTITMESAPPIRIDVAAPLISHTEEFEVAIPADAFNARLASAPLAKLLPGTTKIPAVQETRTITSAPFGLPGATRVVCLADGSTALEQSTESLPGKHFRYVVWAYSIAVAKPIEYGLGEFALSPIDADHTRVTWTYSFKLRSDVVPGNLGALGRWLFKFNFVDGDYADMMHVSAKAMSEYFR